MDSEFVYRSVILNENVESDAESLPIPNIVVKVGRIAVLKLV